MANINPRYSYAIGAGWNLPLGSLTNIELITPTGGTPFYPPESYGTYDPGDDRIRGDGTLYQAGFAFCEWKWGKITRLQISHLSDTYCASGRSGKITVYTRVTSNSYSRFNAVMLLPKLPDSRHNFLVQQDYVVRLTRLQAL